MYWAVINKKNKKIKIGILKYKNWRLCCKLFSKMFIKN